MELLDETYKKTLKKQKVYETCLSIVTILSDFLENETRITRSGNF